MVRRRFPPEEAKKSTSKKAIGNAFQNIDRGRRLFARLGEDPYACLSADELACVRVNIEKRHVVGHNLSMADEAYRDATQSERPGETVEIRAATVTRFADLCGRVVGTLEEGCSEFLPP